jgi:hypothetical protein
LLTYIGPAAKPSEKQQNRQEKEGANGNDHIWMLIRAVGFFFGTAEPILSVYTPYQMMTNPFQNPDWYRPKKIHSSFLDHHRLQGLETLIDHDNQEADHDNQEADHGNQEADRGNQEVGAVARLLGRRNPVAKEAVVVALEEGAHFDDDQELHMLRPQKVANRVGDQVMKDIHHDLFVRSSRQGGMNLLDTKAIFFDRRRELQTM